MTTAKRLVCGHLFHVHCLRSWLERQHTCPICRALVIPNESGTSASRSRTGVHRQGQNFHILLNHGQLFIFTEKSCKTELETSAKYHQYSRRH